MSLAWTGSREAYLTQWDSPTKRGFCCDGGGRKTGQEVQPLEGG